MTDRKTELLKTVRDLLTPGVVCFISIIMMFFVLCVSEEYSPSLLLWLLEFCAFAIGCAAMVWSFFQRTRYALIAVSIGLVIGISLGVWRWQIDTYCESDNVDDVHILRWINRSDVPVHISLNGDGWNNRGPLSESGKRHGEWTLFTYRPEFDIQTVWYWYGEEVSEGEWVLRNSQVSD
ncbi:hypothetical protein KOR42_06220 [Thalassoglobus neptunius]|uniref:Uncharacterized protein n=1 Tax=Thalassoglobus neptunius TaxID=1938619 RepID=A0A5C5X2A8_9PLAN|nr:hypothetical protein [Thalassoglobus neptunius]TWT57264.1 hypothetical protein KOR42_06220 [Thalassoglobus neptunius]